MTLKIWLRRRNLQRFTIILFHVYIKYYEIYKVQLLILEQHTARKIGLNSASLSFFNMNFS